MKKKSAVPERDARAIMNSNFFGTEEAVDHFKIVSPHECPDLFSGIPFSEEKLEKNKYTHILTAVFPISIVEIGNVILPELFYSEERNWYKDLSFATRRGKAGWCLMRKKIFDHSTYRTWKQQCCISKNEHALSARVLVYSIMGCYFVSNRNSKEHLFEDVFVRTNSTAYRNFRVIVGHFNSTGLRINLESDYKLLRDVGIATAFSRTI